LLTISRLGKLESSAVIAGDYSTPITPPVSDYGGGWSEKHVDCPNAHFTGVRAWTNLGAEAAWYQDFARRILEEDEYETLGIAVDALHLIALGAAKSTFISICEPRRMEPLFPTILPTSN